MNFVGGDDDARLNMQVERDWRQFHGSGRDRVASGLPIVHSTMIDMDVLRPHRFERHQNKVWADAPLIPIDDDFPFGIDSPGTKLPGDSFNGDGVPSPGST